jgi:hypothetical protein
VRIQHDIHSQEIDMLRTINRGAVVVSHKQAFLNMVAKLMSEEPGTAPRPFADESKWPRDISWKEFESYFHISFQSMVFDLGDEEIELE